MNSRIATTVAMGIAIICVIVCAVGGFMFADKVSHDKETIATIDEFRKQVPFPTVTQIDSKADGTYCPQLAATEARLQLLKNYALQLEGDEAAAFTIIAEELGEILKVGRKYYAVESDADLRLPFATHIESRDDWKRAAKKISTALKGNEEWQQTLSEFKPSVTDRISEQGLNMTFADNGMRDFFTAHFATNNKKVLKLELEFLESKKEMMILLKKEWGKWFFNEKDYITVFESKEAGKRWKFLLALQQRILEDMARAG